MFKALCMQSEGDNNNMLLDANDNMCEIQLIIESYS